MERWTMEELREADDISFAIDILEERRSKLNRYSPLSLKLQEAQATLRRIKAEKDAFLRAIAGTPDIKPEIANEDAEVEE